MVLIPHGEMISLDLTHPFIHAVYTDYAAPREQFGGSVLALTHTSLMDLGAM